MFPENVVQASFQRVQTKASAPKKAPPKVKADPPPVQAAQGGAAASGGIQQHWVKKKTENVMGMNVLGKQFKNGEYISIALYGCLRHNCVLHRLWNRYLSAGRKGAHNY